LTTRLFEETIKVAKPALFLVFAVSGPESERISITDKSTESPAVPQFDVLALFAEMPVKRPEKDASQGRDTALGASTTEKGAVELNRWRHSGSPQEGVDTLKLSSEYKVSKESFEKANPEMAGKFSELATTGSYKLWHPTTGQVDDGWRLKGRNPDGTVTFSKDYQFDVKAGEHSKGVVEAMPGVPRDYVDQVERKLKQVPPHLMESLEKKGYKVIVAATIPDAVPALAKLTPRGWPEDMTFFDSDGTHDDVSKRIIAPMRVMRDGQLDAVTRENVVVHQVGHALDFAHGFLSSDPEFVKAYDRDMAAIFDKKHPIYQYFAQPNGPGRQETFASLFGLALNMPENETDRSYLTRNFPNTMKVVREQMKNIK